MDLSNRHLLDLSFSMSSLDFIITVTSEVVFEVVFEMESVLKISEDGVSATCMGQETVAITINTPITGMAILIFLDKFLCCLGVIDHHLF